MQPLSDFGYLVHGIGLGASIAMPLGPMKILCLRRVMAWGAAAGIVTAAGVVSGDAVYVAIAALGLNAVMSLLHTAGPALRLIGGLALLYLAFDALRRPIPKSEPSLERKRAISMYAGTIGLTLTNPTTIVMFATVLMSSGDAIGKGGASVAGGMVLGSALVWTVFATVAIVAGKRLTPARLMWLNRGAAILLIYFGLEAIWSAAKLVF
ncbi:MAG: LysE family translocator [Beijerinckiaceae bacterium]